MKRIALAFSLICASTYLIALPTEQPSANQKKERTCFSPLIIKIVAALYMARSISNFDSWRDTDTYIKKLIPFAAQLIPWTFAIKYTADLSEELEPRVIAYFQRHWVDKK